MAARFHHIGVPTSAKRGSETYIPGGKLFVTDPDAHPYRVEFVRFEKESEMPDLLKTRPHAAFLVDNLDAAIKGQNVVIPPFQATPQYRVAFITDGDALLELMEEKK